VKGYKGFDKDLKCLDMQYEVGKDYETKEKPIRCGDKGFHMCKFPFDVFGYYAPAGNRFCEVEGGGEVDECSEDSKVAVSRIHIGAEIGLKGIIEAGVKFILDKVDWKNSKESNTGDRSAATNAGDRSAATNTGSRSAATNTGSRSAATNTGNYSAATNTGSRSAATNTGNYSAATNAGDRSAATNTGYQSAATNTGDRSAATNTGYQSAATNTGDRSAATNAGDRSAATNTGSRSAATNTGDRSAATNTGYYSAATNTGDRSAASVEGKESVAMAIGYESKAKGALGCWLVLAEWEQDSNGKWHIKTVKSAMVDGKRIKPDTWYMLRNGKFVEEASAE
jgi:hypothetical protein